MTEGQGTKSAKSHRNRIENRNPRVRNDRRSLKVVSDQREVSETGSHQSCSGKVDPEDSRQAAGFHLFMADFQILGLWIQDARNHKERQRQHCGYEQDAKSASVIPTMNEHERNHQWPAHRAELVEGLVQTKAPAEPNPLRRVREHDITRGIANRASHTLSDNQSSCRLPVRRQSQ